MDFGWEERFLLQFFLHLPTSLGKLSGHSIFTNMSIHIVGWFGLQLPCITISYHTPNLNIIIACCCCLTRICLVVQLNLFADYWKNKIKLINYESSQYTFAEQTEYPIIHQAWYHYTCLNLCVCDCCQCPVPVWWLAMLAYLTTHLRGSTYVIARFTTPVYLKIRKCTAERFTTTFVMSWPILGQICYLRLYIKYCCLPVVLYMASLNILLNSS